MGVFYAVVEISVLYAVDVWSCAVKRAGSDSLVGLLWQPQAGIGWGSQLSEPTPTESRGSITDSMDIPSSTESSRVDGRKDGSSASIKAERKRSGDGDQVCLIAW